MNYDKYLEEVENRTYTNIVKAVNEINNLTMCPNCNLNSFNDYVCSKCGKPQNDLRKNIRVVEKNLKRFLDIIENLNIDKFPSNKLTNLLLTLKDIKLSCLREFWQEVSLENRSKEEIDAILKRLKDDELTDQDVIILEELINENDPNVNLLKVYNYFIKNAILERKPMVSYECFKEIIKNLSLRFLDFSCTNGKCLIVPQKKLNKKYIHILGSSSGMQSKSNTIKISEDGVKELYKEGRVGVFTVIFHELAHIKQKNVIFSGEHITTMFSNYEIKDYIMSLYHEGYYNENYVYLASELEALYTEIGSLSVYLGYLGIDVEKKKIDERKKEILASLSSKRYLKGKEVDLNQEFLKIIKIHPEYLEEFPQLKEDKSLANKKLSK